MISSLAYAVEAHFDMQNKGWQHVLSGTHRAEVPDLAQNVLDILDRPEAR